MVTGCLYILTAIIDIGGNGGRISVAGNGGSVYNGQGIKSSGGNRSTDRLSGTVKRYDTRGRCKSRSVIGKISLMKILAPAIKVPAV